jgi:hypothetical protein
MTLRFEGRGWTGGGVQGALSRWGVTGVWWGIGVVTYVLTLFSRERELGWRYPVVVPPSIEQHTVPGLSMVLPGAGENNGEAGEVRM